MLVKGVTYGPQILPDGKSVIFTDPSSEPYKIVVSASLRMVADLSDPDKITAVLPGGVAGRQFDPHTTDQVQPFIDGTKRYWWFSDQAIKEHSQHTLTLSPN